MADVNAKLAPALALLCQEQDESKFVGLLLVAKALTPPPPPVASTTSSSAPTATSTHSAPAPTSSIAAAAEDDDAFDEKSDASPAVRIAGLRSNVPGPDLGCDSDDDGDNATSDSPEARAENSPSTDAASTTSPFDTSVLLAIFDAVGYKFLARLVKTTRGENAQMSQRLGLNILSTLCMHPAIAAQCRALAPEVVAIVQSECVYISYQSFRMFAVSLLLRVSAYTVSLTRSLCTRRQCNARCTRH